MTELHTKDSENRCHVGGIKFSPELVQITVAKRSSQDSSFEELLQLIAEQTINIPFLCHSGVTQEPESVFCVDSKDLSKVQAILKHSTFANSHIDITSSVGTLTLFPHRYSFSLLGLIIGVFGQYRYPIYSLCTSISTIALNTDYLSLDNIAKKLQTVIELPKNHAPFRQEFCLKQINQ